MEAPFRKFSSFVCIFLIIFYIILVRADALDTSTLPSEVEGFLLQSDCAESSGRKDIGGKIYTSGGVDNHQDDKDIDIIATYTDTFGVVQIGTVKSKDLSASWVWENSISERHDQEKNSERWLDSSRTTTRPENFPEDSVVELRSRDVGEQYPHMSILNPVKLKRQEERERRKDLRTAELIRQDKETDDKKQAAAIERSKELDTTAKERYSIWRREYGNPKLDYILKLMRDQIIMAKAYASIARSKNESSLYNELQQHIKKSERAIGEANLDSELSPSALDRAKAMGRILSKAKEQYRRNDLTRILRAMVQTTETTVTAKKKQGQFLIQLAAKTVPKQLTCLSLLLTNDYFLKGRQQRVSIYKNVLEDPSLYHYAIFSDNVLATSVVVNSTVLHAKEPQKHVFHIVTDKLSFAAMKMWFLVNNPANVAVQIENIDDFKWLNSSYCSVLRQLESAQMRAYYFKASHPSTVSDGLENLKYRNPKYLSMLNHLRFYLPEVYPKLEKILFLDDDIVVQKDLTPLWSVDMQGMVNAAVETCKESFHRFDKYLNFSNPKISENFDPDACGWAFGMNMFDLKEWRKRNMTGVYHYWQDLNEDRLLWKLGSLPPGLITFYNLTYPLDRSWHVLGLGYDSTLNETEIDNAAVVHYNGNYKPWLELVIAKYKSYWSKYLMPGNPYLKFCGLYE